MSKKFLVTMEDEDFERLKKVLWGLEAVELSDPNEKIISEVFFVENRGREEFDARKTVTVQEVYTVQEV